MKKLVRYGAIGTVFASGLVVAACANYESGSGGNIYANFPVTEKTYKGSKKTSVSYTGQIARHTLHDSIKSLAGKCNGSPNPALKA